MIGRFLRALSAPIPEPVDEDIARVELEAERDRLQRERDGLFELVVKLEKQRDDWKFRFFEQSQQHANAQSMLEAHIQQVGTTLMRAVEMLNDARKRAGEEAVTAIGLRDLALAGGKVLKTADEYRAAMEKLAATAPRRDHYGQVIGWSDAPAQADIDAEKSRADVVAGC